MSLIENGKCLASELENKKVLLIGGGGFIGTNLTEHLINNGADVCSVSRSFLSAYKAPTLKQLTIDFTDEYLMRSHCEWADCVIYLAGNGGPVGSHNHIINGVSEGVVDTLGFIEQCAKSSVGQFIFISSGGTVYGDADTVPTPETAQLKPKSPYAINKVVIEHYLKLFDEIYAMSCVTLRVSNPYGPYQTGKKNQGVIGRFMDLSRKGEPIPVWGDGSVIRDFLYVDDLCEAIIKVTSYSGDCKIINVGSGYGLSLNEVIDVMRSQGLRVEIERKPSVSAVKSSVLDITLAKQELNWQPSKKLHDGIKYLAAWLDEYN